MVFDESNLAVRDRVELTTMLPMPPAMLTNPVLHTLESSRYFMGRHRILQDVSVELRVQNLFQHLHNIPNISE